MHRKINEAGLNMLKEREGCRLEAYLDGGGVPTIGYGHTGPEVFLGLRITQDQADELLKDDLSYFCNAVEALVDVPLNDNQFSALVVFTYNIGVTAFKKSTLLALLNNGGYEDAANQFKRWNKDNGKVVDGLTTRRLMETALFNS